MSIENKKPMGQGAAETKAAFEALGDFKGMYSIMGVDYANRIAAAEAGLPAKPKDAKRLDFLKRELSELQKAVFKKTPEALEELKKYKLPQLDELVKKDKDGKVIMNNPAFEKYKWALAFAAPEKQAGVRDFRNAKDLRINIDPQRFRISLTTERNSPDEQFSYDIKRFIASVLGESLDHDGRQYSFLPYAHVDKEGKVASKTLIMLNDLQRSRVRQAIMEYLKNNA